MNGISYSGDEAVFFGGRHYFVLFVLMFFLASLIARALYLQIVEQEFLYSQGEQRQIRTIETPAYRGTIRDRSGTALAIVRRLTRSGLIPPKFYKTCPR
jgi:cell division protein FtsI/penicillin-binding protein 2